ncbi:alginate O-acetyltransferase AlgX-related protein [Kordia sp.]|uniref:alginate O-acetyltransferase AlgX-related protein n=1 Tax=Kordia sp. TaxID=1965332 RepID=UPI003B5962E1
MKNKKMTREEIAMIDIGSTDISKSNQKLLLVFFLLLMVSAMIIQIIWKEDNEHITNTNFHSETVSAEATSFFTSISNKNDKLLTNIKGFETGIEESSIYRKTLIPFMQAGLLNVFRTGNENAWVSKDNFYYKYSNQYLTQAGFLETQQLNKRAKEESIQPNPLKAILDFKEKLAKRNIQLVIVPAPPKAAVTLKNDQKLLNNASYNDFLKFLMQNDIAICDVFSLVEREKLEADSYLRYDTHWSPTVMNAVSKEIGKLLDSLNIPKGNTIYTKNKLTVSNYGDIVDMLTMEGKDNYFETQTVEIEQILEDNFLFKPSRQSDILFLGDSYANIYSLEAMNWGTSAGLSEHISMYMQKPVDRIQMNDAGAYVTRLSLSNELKRGKDRLEGKKVVVWEFAARELCFGDWKIVPMQLNEDYVSEFFVPEEKTSVTVTGIVSETSNVPIPNTVPYKDHVVSVHLTAMKDIGTGKELGESVVYLSSMKDNVWTAAARLRNGQKVTITLHDWNTFSDRYGAMNRSELQDDELSFADPCWGILKINNHKE